MKSPEESWAYRFGRGAAWLPHNLGVYKLFLPVFMGTMFVLVWTGAALYMIAVVVWTIIEELVVLPAYRLIGRFANRFIKPS